jgi:hypothetical protein
MAGLKKFVIFGGDEDALKEYHLMEFRTITASSIERC